jgi:hypothetical protein
MKVPAVRGSSLTMGVLATSAIFGDLEVAYFPDFTRVTTNFVDWCGVYTDLYKALKHLGLVYKTPEEAAAVARKMLDSISD